MRHPRHRRPSPWLIALTLLCLICNLVPVSATAAAQAVSAASFTLALAADGGGTVIPSPAGPTHAAGTVVTLAATPSAGSVLVGWTVDGAPRGWANPLTITMDADHTVTATFVPRPSFSDVPPGHPAHEYVTNLAAREIIKGYSPDECALRGLASPCFGPTDPIVRAQVAALIVRSFGWGSENPGGALPFSDLGGIDPELQRAIATLASRGIINGYGDTTFGPTDEVLHIQVVSFIARAMVQAGHWSAVTGDNPAIYPNVPLSSGHRLDLLTFVANAGPIADRQPDRDWVDWDTPASRAWTGGELWAGLDSFFGGTGANPTPKPSGGPGPGPSLAPGNTAPVAANDAYTVTEDAPLTVPANGVLANDSDPEGNPLTAVRVAGPAHGGLILQPGGSLTYTPAPDYNGPDSFTYQARDTSGALSAPATVALTVTPVNDAPTNTAPGAQNATANTALRFSVANGNAITVGDVDAGGSPLRVTLAATNGTLTLGVTAGLASSTGNGTAAVTIVGTLAAINAALDGLTFAPGAGYTGPASVRIVADDQGNTGAGGPLADDDTIAIAIGVGAATTIAKEGGDGGSATVATTRTLRVKVTDGTGVAVQGYTVNWAVTLGGGMVAAPTSTTDASGVATIDWTLGTTAGAQSATATATGLSGSPLTFGATATPGPAATATSTITANPTSIVANGAATSTITVQLKDQYGNALTAGGGTVALNTTAGTLGPVVDNGDGSYTVTLTASITAGVATVSGTLDSAAIDDTAAVTFTAGAATTIVKQAGDGQSATVGTAVATAPAALVTDANGNPVAGVTVTFAVASGGGGVTGASRTTGADGLATVGSWTLGTAAGANTLTASATGLTAVTFTATATAGATTQLGISTQPADTAQSGVALSRQPIIQLRDQYGNAVGQAGVVVTAALASGGGTIGGTATATTNGSGVATFTDLAIAGTVGDRTLSFTTPLGGGSSASVTSTIIALAAGPVSRLALTTQPSSTAQSGTALARQPVVQLQDASGNPINQSGVAVTAALASGGGTLGGTVTKTTDATGAAIFDDLSITGLAGDRTLAFSAAGLTGATSSTITLTAGAATQLALTTQPSATAQAGIALPRQPVVQVQDASGNAVDQAGVAVTVAIASGGGTLGGTATAMTDATGAATFTGLSIGGTIGDRTLAFSAAGLAGATSGTITLTAGAATALAFAVPPADTVASAPITPAVQVSIVDAYGNAVSGATDNVTVAVGNNPSGGILSGTTTVAAVTGAATFANLSINLVGSGYTLTAASGALSGATSVGFNVTHGPLDHFLIEAAGRGAIGTQKAGTPFNVRVTAQDAYNNTVTAFTGTVAFTSTPTGGPSAGATSGAFTAGTLTSHGITFGTPGSFTLTATRTGGAESGTSNSFAVQAPPVAANDGPAPGSAPGQPYHASFSTSGSPQTFNLSAPGVLSNDNLGFPVATITSFGADSVGGSVTTYAAGSTVSPLPGAGVTTGSLSVGADGTIVFTPPDDFTGNYVFRYRLTNARGTADGQVTIAVGIRPSATNDTYAPVLVGNVPINTATSTQFTVIANDQGDAKVLAITSQSNGTALFNADATFRFRPNPGYEGSASFTYTVTNGFGTSAPATVALTVANPIWFVNPGATTNGDGRLDAPFTCLVGTGCFSQVAADEANDRIFLYSGAHTGGLTLLVGQRLIGQGASGAFGDSANLSVTWPADSGATPTLGGTAPAITVTAASTNGITLGSGNTLRGFALGNATGAALSGTNFGTLTVSEVGINNTGGQALSLSAGTLNGSFPVLRSTGGANNVSLTGVATSGTATLGTSADSLAGATGDAVAISGEAGSFTYAGSVSNTTALAVNVANKTGGTVTFSGSINPAAAGRGIAVSGNSTGTNVIAFSGAQQWINSGTAAGVSLSNNTGATISFTGGGLAITTGSGSGFTATGGGTVTVTGAANAISSAGGVALNVANTTVGGGGLTFRSISANGGANGIVLDNTGASGGLTVTGNGGTCMAASTTGCTGGTIAGATGGDNSGATPGGAGIVLNNTRSVSLTRMWIHDHSNYGIRGTSVVDFTLNNSLINGVNGTNATTPFHDSSVYFLELSGTVTVAGTAIGGGWANNFWVSNTAGTLASTFTGVTIGANSTTGGNDGIQIEGLGTATVNVTIQNSAFTSSRGDLFQYIGNGSGGGSLVLTGNAFSNNHPAIATGGGGVTVSGGASGPVAMNISGNTARDALTAAFTVGKSIGSGSLDLTVANNTIGLAGTANSGSAEGSGITVTHFGNGTLTAAVTGNQVYQYNNYGLYFQVGAGIVSGGNLNVTVSGNTIANPGNNPNIGGVFQGLHLNSGVTPGDSAQVCFQPGANTINGSGRNGGTDFRLRQRQNTTVRLPGYTGGARDTAAVVTYEQILIGGSPTGSAFAETSTGGGFVGGASCAQPTAAPANVIASADGLGRQVLAGGWSAFTLADHLGWRREEAGNRA